MMATSGAFIIKDCPGLEAILITRSLRLEGFEGKVRIGDALALSKRLGLTGMGIVVLWCRQNDTR